VFLEGSDGRLDLSKSLTVLAGTRRVDLHGGGLSVDCGSEDRVVLGIAAGGRSGNDVHLGRTPSKLLEKLLSMPWVDPLTQPWTTPHLIELVEQRLADEDFETSLHPGFEDRQRDAPPRSARIQMLVSPKLSGS
jgi:hypothetical protein